MWIGMTYVGDQTGWQWEDQSEPTYIQWGQGEPNNWDDGYDAVFRRTETSVQGSGKVFQTLCLVIFGKLLNKPYMPNNFLENFPANLYRSHRPPKNGVYATCVEFSKNGNWRDGFCNSTLPYYCKKPAETEYCAAARMETLKPCGFVGITEEECMKDWKCCFDLHTEIVHGQHCFTPATPENE